MMILFDEIPQLVRPDQLTGAYLFDDAWWRMSEERKPIDSIEYWGEDVEFIFSKKPRTGSASFPDRRTLIALANFDYLCRSIRNSLSSIRTATYPPAPVLATMFEEALFEKSWEIALPERIASIEWLEQGIDEALTLLRPTVFMFVCSLPFFRGFREQKCDRVKPCQQRDRRFVELSDAGMSSKEIAADFKSETGNHVTDVAVRTAISRYRNNS